MNYFLEPESLFHEMEMFENDSDFLISVTYKQYFIKDIKIFNLKETEGKFLSSENI